MNKIIDIYKDRLNVPSLIFLIAIIIGIINLFSYLLPLTDDAFVVANNQPVAADVSGYVSEIYVKNGQAVKQGSPLFKVFDEPYKLALNKSRAAYEQAQGAVEQQIQQIQKDKQTLATAQINLAKATYEYKLKSNPSVGNSVSELELKNTKYSMQLLEQEVNSDITQLKIDDSVLAQKHKALEQAEAAVKSDKVNLAETIVRAGSTS